MFRSDSARRGHFSKFFSSPHRRAPLRLFKCASDREPLTHELADSVISLCVRGKHQWFDLDDNWLYLTQAMRV